MFFIKLRIWEIALLKEKPKVAKDFLRFATKPHMLLSFGKKKLFFNVSDVIIFITVVMFEWWFHVYMTFVIFCGN